MATRRSKLARHIRPLSTVDILDEAIDIYKSNFVLLLGIVAIVDVPYLLLYQIVLQQQWGVLASSLPSLIVQPIIGAAIVYAVSDIYLKRQSSIIACYRRIRPVFWPLLGAVVARFILVDLPLMSLIPDSHSNPKDMALSGLLVLILLPWFIYGNLRLLLVASICVLEHVGVRKALARSWHLMRNSLCKAFWLYAGIFLVVGISYTILLQLARFIPGISVPNSVVQRLIGAVFSLAFSPFYGVVTVLYYYDVRVRKEGLDIELFVAQLDGDNDVHAFSQEYVAQDEVRS